MTCQAGLSWVLRVMDNGACAVVACSGEARSKVSKKSVTLGKQVGSIPVVVVVVVVVGENRGIGGVSWRVRLEG